ncbi:MAG: MFS transporter [Clostridia bacterium]|nr:MFS transporter [Clostridia bacterium]
MNKISGAFKSFGAAISGLCKSVIGAVKSFFMHWNRPAEGNYVPSKETVAYSVGGMGVQLLAVIYSNVTLGSTCLLLGSIYGMKPTTLALLGFINAGATIVLQPLKSWLIDNTPGNKGKARPWMLWLSIPCAVLLTSLAFMDTGWNELTMTIVVGILFIMMNFIYQFYLGQYSMLAQLLSPNSQERANIISISSLVYSFAPTITGALIPQISKLFKLGQLDQNFYRTIFPVFAILGVLLTLLVYFGTKERVIVPKAYKQKVKFKDAMKKIVRNKYMWILNITTWFQFGRGAITGILMWLYIYVLQNANIQSILSLVLGTASGIGMFMAPFLIKFFGKRNVAIFTNLIAAAASAILIAFPNNIVLLFISTYIVFWAVAVQIISSPAMNADALDYQQYATGDRFEGMSGNLGMIGQVIALGTGFIIPALYEFNGLLDDYDILYDTVVREPLFRSLAILSAVFGVLCAVPFFFWDLNEKKHKMMIEALKERAAKDNILHGYEHESVLSSGELFDGTDSLEVEMHSSEILDTGAADIDTEEIGVADIDAADADAKVKEEAEVVAEQIDSSDDGGEEV